LAPMSTDFVGRTPEGRGYDAVFFLAMLATALSLGGGLAHAFALPNKIGLPSADYFTVQQIYRGWNQFAYLLLVQLLSLVTLAVMSRWRPEVFWPVLLSIAGLACAQAVFWLFTFPANRATNNWTSVPPDWEAWRASWEYSHLAGAGFQLLAMSFLIVAALRRARHPR
jgi:hypothetical protein